MVLKNFIAENGDLTRRAGSNRILLFKSGDPWDSEGIHDNLNNETFARVARDQSVPDGKAAFQPRYDWLRHSSLFR